MGVFLMYSVKEGGPSPAANAALAQLLQQAKDTDVPRDIIDRNMKKATEKGQQDFVELTYEVMTVSRELYNQGRVLLCRIQRMFYV